MCKLNLKVPQFFCSLSLFSQTYFSHLPTINSSMCIFYVPTREYTYTPFFVFHQEEHILKLLYDLLFKFKNNECHGYLSMLAFHSTVWTCHHLFTVSY